MKQKLGMKRFLVVANAMITDTPLRRVLVAFELENGRPKGQAIDLQWDGKPIPTGLICDVTPTDIIDVLCKLVDNDKADIDPYSIKFNASGRETFKAMVGEFAINRLSIFHAVNCKVADGKPGTPRGKSMGYKVPGGVGTVHGVGILDPMFADNPVLWEDSELILVTRGLKILAAIKL